MGIKDTSKVKVRPELPYMTAGERHQFKQLRDAGAITFFRVAFCSCGAEMAQGKKACSEACFNRLEKKDSNEDDTDGASEGDAPRSEGGMDR